MDVNGSSALLLASAAAFAGEAEGVQWDAAGNCLRLADAHSGHDSMDGLLLPHHREAKHAAEL